MEEAVLRNLEKPASSFALTLRDPTVQKEIADKNSRAFAVVIVGSRQILVREMGRHGNWVNKFHLCEMGKGYTQAMTWVCQLLAEEVFHNRLK
jgi:hypothetical protein